MRFLLILALLCPLPVCAESCLTAVDLTYGIDVTLKGGVVHRYSGTANGDVQAIAPDVTAGEGFERSYVFRKGLFVVKEHLVEREVVAEDVVGGNDGGTIDLITQPRGSLPKVRPDTVWTGRVKFRRDQDGPSIGPQEPVTAVLDGTLRMLAERSVTLSGCVYRIVPVETRLAVGTDSRLRIGNASAEEAGAGDDTKGRAMILRRQIYFLDLGFSVVTQESDEMGALPVYRRGIVGMARAGD